MDSLENLDGELQWNFLGAEPAPMGALWDIYEVFNGDDFFEVKIMITEDAQNGHKNVMFNVAGNNVPSIWREGTKIGRIENGDGKISVTLNYEGREQTFDLPQSNIC